MIQLQAFLLIVTGCGLYNKEQCFDQQTERPVSWGKSVSYFFGGRSGNVLRIGQQCACPIFSVYLLKKGPSSTGEIIQT
jgi:hypothetical protein